MINKFIGYLRGKLKGFGRSGRRKSVEVEKVSFAQPLTKDFGRPKKTGGAAGGSVVASPLQTSPTRVRSEKKFRRSKVVNLAQSSWDAAQFDVVPVEGKSRFHDFDLPAPIMHAIYDLGFTYCTPIQALTIEKTLADSDAIAQAQTGTGKTVAFLITVLSKLLLNPSDNKKNGFPRALVLAPTRELVMQIAEEGRQLAKYCNMSIVPLFGGMDYDKQQQAIDKCPVDIIVATPGRLLDFQRQQIVTLGRVEVLVIDEADRMLDMGFIPDVRKIVSKVTPREKRQTLMFSATMTADVRRLASQWCVDPITVEVAPENVAVDTVEQIIYLTTAREKYNILYNIITRSKLERVLVFTNRRDETRKLTERLTRNQISCEMLSGDVAQKKRVSTLEKFREGKIKVLVATDVAGRGIHIDGISHVFNYTLPYESEDYVHRIGRTGRAGNAGISISFADEEGAFYIPEIEKYIGRKLTCRQPEEDLLDPAPPGSGKLAQQPPSTNKPRRSSPGRRYSNKAPRFKK